MTHTHSLYIYSIDACVFVFYIHACDYTRMLFIKFDIDLLFFLVSFVGYMSKPKIFEMLAFQNFGQWPAANMHSTTCHSSWHLNGSERLVKPSYPSYGFLHHLTSLIFLGRLLSLCLHTLIPCSFCYAKIWWEKLLRPILTGPADKPSRHCEISLLKSLVCWWLAWFNNSSSIIWMLTHDTPEADEQFIVFLGHSH